MSRIWSFPFVLVGWATYAYFRAMDECDRTTPANNGAGSVEAEVDNQEAKRSDEAEAFMEIALADDCHSHSEDMESGGGRHS